MDLCEPRSGTPLAHIFLAMKETLFSVFALFGRLRLHRPIAAMLLLTSWPLLAFSAMDHLPFDMLEKIPGMRHTLANEAPQPYPLHRVLKDEESRLPELWEVPKGLYHRTYFWLLVYSRFSSDHYLIHHRNFPWIVYDVIGVSDLKPSQTKRWRKHSILSRRTRNRVSQLRQSLLQLSRKSSYKDLSREQRRLFDLLDDVPGSRQKVFAEAAEELRYQLGQKNFFRAGLINGRRYIETMESIFAEEGLPVELTRLPLVESSFNENAVSKVGASGVWQIMPAVGRSFLTVNETIDERNSPLKATRAAARLLRNNYGRLKKWPLAVTAYNHGSAGLARAVRTLHTTDIGKIVLNYQGRAFGFASKNFYAGFLAALHAEKYQQELFGELPEPPSSEFFQVDLNLPKPISTQRLAQLSQLSEGELLSHNLDLRKAAQQRKKIPANHSLILPAKNAEILRENLFVLSLIEETNGNTPTTIQN